MSGAALALLDRLLGRLDHAKIMHVTRRQFGVVSAVALVVGPGLLIAGIETHHRWLGLLSLVVLVPWVMWAKLLSGWPRSIDGGGA